MPPPRSSAALPMAAAFVLLIVYASLYPFSGWSVPKGHDLDQLWRLPWPRRSFPYDTWANLVAYLPLGGLLYAGLRRSGLGVIALAAAVLLSSALSYAMEFAQNYLPERVPSLLDWSLNTLGAGIGAVAAALLQASGATGRWQALRERWFVDASVGARVLLMLWPIALLFPTPLPLAPGQLGEPLRQLAQAALDGTPWANQLDDWLGPVPWDTPPLHKGAEALAVMLGALAPCLLAHSAMQRGPRRIVLALGLVAAGFAATTLSTALNFGPQHALAWLTPVTLPALAVGALLACALAWLGRRLAAALALVTVTGMLALVAQAPSDPYFAESLQAWQQGRFIRFHGLAQWLGWVWPYLAIGWLLLRLGGRDDR